MTPCDKPAASLMYTGRPLFSTGILLGLVKHVNLYITYIAKKTHPYRLTWQDMLQMINMMFDSVGFRVPVQLQYRKSAVNDVGGSKEYSLMGGFKRVCSPLGRTSNFLTSFHRLARLWATQSKNILAQFWESLTSFKLRVLWVLKKTATH